MMKIKRAFDKFYESSPNRDRGLEKGEPAFFGFDWRGILADAFGAGWQAANKNRAAKERATHSAAKKRRPRKALA